jgi:hypothetical protein
VSLLEARLTEEKDWRKQLEVDLTSAQGALKKDKEVGAGPSHRQHSRAHDDDDDGIILCF